MLNQTSSPDIRESFCNLKVLSLSTTGFQCWPQHTSCMNQSTAISSAHPQTWPQGLNKPPPSPLWSLATARQHEIFLALLQKKIHMLLLRSSIHKSKTMKYPEVSFLPYNSSKHCTIKQGRYIWFYSLFQQWRFPLKIVDKVGSYFPFSVVT